MELEGLVPCSQDHTVNNFSPHSQTAVL